MKSTGLCILLLAALVVAGQAKVDYDTWFTDKTMRVDYYHTGTARNEFFSLDQVYQEGEWPGSRVNLADTLNLGKYLVKVFDEATGRLVYSRGYCTVFGEWQTTVEALSGSVYRTMHETVRFPFPKYPIKLVIAVRNRQNEFIDTFSAGIEPGSRSINLEKRDLPWKTEQYLDNGSPKKKVDIVIMGDGYTHKEMGKFRQDVKHYTEQLFNSQPFSSRKNDFNIRLVLVESAESGIDEPHLGNWRQTALGASYNSLDSPRYVLTLANKEVRDIAALVPYDQLYILVNSTRYGGGGIFNWYATSFTGHAEGQPDWWADYVFTHEFGHSFAGLADEYYTSDTAYEEFYAEGIEPWDPNITRLLNPAQPKWADLITPGTPVPTPWGKAAYDSLGVTLRSWQRETPEYIMIEQQMQRLLADANSLAQTGCYEGAGYMATGMFRSAPDCRMFSKSLTPFCLVCQRAINRMIDFYTR
ncbi:MAG TPA: M64 family metallopeptidase [bacterium]|nr:M64 family metallopeptidase [bacterium]HPN44637.1 M64 family metallopeptidase [bacterium]